VLLLSSSSSLQLSDAVEQVAMEFSEDCRNLWFLWISFFVSSILRKSSVAESTMLSAASKDCCTVNVFVFLELFVFFLFFFFVVVVVVVLAFIVVWPGLVGDVPAVNEDDVSSMGSSLMVKRDFLLVRNLIMVLAECRLCIVSGRGFDLLLLQFVVGVAFVWRLANPIIIILFVFVFVFVFVLAFADAVCCIFGV